MPRSRSLRRFDWDDDGFEHCAEPAAARRRRLREKAKDGKRARETDRSGSVVHLERAAKRLKHARAKDRVLYVPQWDMAKAVVAMQRAGVVGEVSNLCGSRQSRVTLARARFDDDAED
jgi:hypothetical protein